MNTPAPWDHFAIRRLIFRWPERSVSFLLPLLFLASVAVHGLTFYLFQVVYPPSVLMAPPPAHVTLLCATPENEALLRWVDVQDPSTAARIPELSPPGLADLAYVPSYAMEHSLPKIQDSRPQTSGFPSALDPLALPAAKPAPVLVKPLAVHSSLSFSETLKTRDANPSVPVSINARSAAALHPTEFLAAIDDRGEMRYCFLQAGSGDREIDREAEEVLRCRPFKRTESSEPLAWGFATFAWGVEVYAPTSSSLNSALRSPFQIPQSSPASSPGT